MKFAPIATRDLARVSVNFPRYSIRRDHELPSCYVFKGLLKAHRRIEDDKTIVIGRLAAYLIPEGHSPDDFYTNDTDYIEGIREFCWLRDRDKLNVPSRGCMVVKTLIVHPKLRGRDFGLHFLRDFIDTFQDMAGCFIGKPHPMNPADMSDKAVADGVKALFGHYARLGYRKVRPRSSYNYFDPTCDLPELFSRPPWRD